MSKTIASGIVVAVYLAIAAAIVALAVVAISSQRAAGLQSARDQADVRSALAADAGRFDALDRRLGDLVAADRDDRRALLAIRHSLDHIVVHVHDTGCCR